MGGHIFGEVQFGPNLKLKLGECLSSWTGVQKAFK